MTKFTQLAIILASLSLLSSALQAEENCVDLADSDDIEAFHNCKGEDSRINKALNNLISFGSEKKTAKVVEKDVSKATEKKPIKVEQLEISSEKSTFSDNAMDLLKERHQALLQISNDCPNGFKVLSEQYTPDQNRNLVLQINYQCIGS